MTHQRKAGNLNPANILTILRIFLVPLYLWLFNRQEWYTVVLALVVFVTAAVTDLIDGRLARSRKEVTKLGKFLDPLADKFLVVGALAQFWMLGLVNVWLVGVIIVRDVWVTAMRIVAILRGTELKTSGGAKLKTTIQLTVVITIIVLTGARLILVRYGITPPIIDLAYLRVLFNAMLGVAVVFTLYSWFRYMFQRHPA